MSDESLLRNMCRAAQRATEAANTIGVSMAQASEALRVFGEAVFKATTAEDHEHFGDILMRRAKLEWNPFKAAEFRLLAKQEYAWAQGKRTSTEETV